ncbi:MAG: ATPase [Desulfurococcaceae archaeon]|uniref:ATPase n=1 Tax=Staphylothermus marinus TaxID=2280 RepID=A0A7C4JMX7_STAMA
MSLDIGTALAYFGPPLAEGLAVIGTALGIQKAASVGLSVISEDPKMMARVYALAFLPATQTMVYGFGYLFLIYSMIRSYLETHGSIPLHVGAGILALSIFVGLAEMWSAYKQGEVCADGAALLIKTEGRLFPSTIILAAYEELFGILGLAFGFLISSLLLAT